MDMASPDDLLAMLEEAAVEAENTRNREMEDEYDVYHDAIDELMDELIDDMSLGLCFEVHRQCKIGTFYLDHSDKDSDKKYEVIEGKGLDVFGQPPMRKQLECVCPNCHRNLAASRFAPHLEKCMGMGRNSSRIASRRIANSGKKDSDNELSDDNDNDNDWNIGSDTKRGSKKAKKDKSNGSLKRNKGSKHKNGDIPSVGSTGSNDSASFTPAYETMPIEERRILLHQTCGVISEHTKKMCTRSIRCPQHSLKQRQAVRLYLLGDDGTPMDTDDIQVDIDSYEDGDTQALRDSLHWEAASNPSPSEPTATSNSSAQSGSKKKKPKANKKKSKGSANASSLYEFS